MTINKMLEHNGEKNPCIYRTGWLHHPKGFTREQPAESSSPLLLSAADQRQVQYSFRSIKAQSAKKPHWNCIHCVWMNVQLHPERESIRSSAEREAGSVRIYCEIWLAAFQAVPFKWVGRRLLKKWNDRAYVVGLIALLICVSQLQEMMTVNNSQYITVAWETNDAPRGGQDLT